MVVEKIAGNFFLLIVTHEGIFILFADYACRVGIYHLDRMKFYTLLHCVGECAACGSAVGELKGKGFFHHHPVGKRHGLIAHHGQTFLTGFDTAVNAVDAGKSGVERKFGRLREIFHSQGPEEIAAVGSRHRRGEGMQCCQSRIALSFAGGEWHGETVFFAEKFGVASAVKIGHSRSRSAGGIAEVENTRHHDPAELFRLLPAAAQGHLRHCRTAVTPAAADFQGVKFKITLIDATDFSAGQREFAAQAQIAAELFCLETAGVKPLCRSIVFPCRSHRPQTFRRRDQSGNAVGKTQLRTQLFQRVIFILQQHHLFWDLVSWKRFSSSCCELCLRLPNMA